MLNDERETYKSTSGDLQEQVVIATEGSVSTSGKKQFVGEDYLLIVHQEGRVANLVAPTLFADTRGGMLGSEMAEITRRVFNHFRDEFDFIFVASNQTDIPSTLRYAGIFYDVQNDIQGTGRPIFDYSSYYGSSGTLSGAIHLPRVDYLRIGPSLHELLHNWGNAMDSVPSEVGGHWGYANIGGQLGGWQPNSLEPLGAGRYQVRSPRSGSIGYFGSFANGGNGLPYSEFELYVMGLISAEQVNQDIKIANDFAWEDGNDPVFTASSITTRTMEQVVALDGARIPSVTNSKKDFRILYLVLSDRILSEDDWIEADNYVQWFDLDAANTSSLYNFYEATGGRATVSMDGIQNALITQIDAKTVRSFEISSDLPNLAEVTISSSSDFTYTLLYSRNFEEWSEGMTMTGTDDDIALTQLTTAEEKLFFRVRIDPIPTF